MKVHDQDLHGGPSARGSHCTHGAHDQNLPEMAGGSRPECAGTSPNGQWRPARKGGPEATPPERHDRRPWRRYLVTTSVRSHQRRVAARCVSHRTRPDIAGVTPGGQAATKLRSPRGVMRTARALGEVRGIPE